MKKKFRTLRLNKDLLLLSIPGIIWFVIFSYIPMFVLAIAFKKWSIGIDFIDSFLNSPWVGLQNFKFLFKNGDGLLIIRNTVLYNLVFIILGVILPLFVALMINEMYNKKLSKVFQSTLFIPYFLSMVVISYIVSSMLDPNLGLVNKVLDYFNVEQINFYNESKYWPFILTFVSIWKTLGYNMIIYLSAICGIDKSCYEAAELDGASRFKQIQYITIPALKPIIIILILMSLGGIFRSDFGLFYQVPKNSPALLNVTQTIDTYVYRGLTNLGGEIGMSAASGLLQSCVGFILVIFSNKIVRKIDNKNTLF